MKLSLPSCLLHMHTKYVDGPLCVIDANVFIMRHRYATLFYYRRNRDVFPCFLSGNAYELSTLKVMLHTVGWRAQQ